MDTATCDERMTARQRELEELNLAESAERFWRRIEGRLDDTERAAGIESRQKQMISMSAPGARFIRDKIQGIVKRLEKERDTIQKGKGGKGSVNANPFLWAEPFEAIAYLALKEIVDRGCRNITAKSPSLFLYDVVINAIGRNVSLELEARKQKDNKDEQPLIADLDRKIKLEKKPMKKRTLSNARKRLIARMANVNFNDETKGRIGLTLYKMLLDEKLVVEEGFDGKKKKARLADDVLELMKKNLELFADQKPIFGPLVIPPRPWSSNKDGGYHFDLKDRHTLMKTPPNDFHEDGAREVFSAVNALQSTAFRINRKVFDVAGNILSAKPDGKTCEKLFGIQQALPPDVRTWLLVAVKRVMMDADRVKDCPKIYFTCFLDFRGRYYCKTTHLNPQGSDLCRGLIEFAEAKPIQDENAEHWLINHGASCYGNSLNREGFPERKKWVRDKANENKMRALIDAPTSPESRDFLKDVDKPWAFLAWCHEWIGYLDKGFGYESRLPVAVDGSCNGIQHFAALMRSRFLAEQVNMTKMEEPKDIYTLVAENTKNRLSERNKAMTWYSSLTVNEITKKYDNYSLQLYEIKSGKKLGKTVEISQKTPLEEPLSDDGIDESAEHSAEEDFNEVGDEIKGADDENKMPAKLRNPERILGKQWDSLSKNKKMECLQECKRQLAERILMEKIPESAPGGAKSIEFNRKLLKSIVMTFPYSATHNGNVKGMVEELSGSVHQPFLNYLKSKDLHVYQLEEALAHAIVRNTRAVIRETATDANLIMEHLKNLLPNDSNKPGISWKSPIGLTVLQHYAKADESNKITLEYSKMKIRLQKYNKGTTALLHKHKQGISPNFVHSCDASHMMKTTNAASDAGIKSFLMIHDSYATHAADVEVLSKILREEFVKMYSEDNPDHPLKRLQDALPPVEGGKPKKKKELARGDFEISEVLEADYFFS